MTIHHPDLLKKIESFTAQSGMSEITFGRKAVRDPHFVRDVRKGRRLWPETEAKIRDFMATYEAASPKDAA